MPLSIGAPTMMISAPLYVSGLSRSHAGIPRNVKLGPYIFPMLVMEQVYMYESNNGRKSLFRSQAGIWLKIKFGMFAFPLGFENSIK